MSFCGHCGLATTNDVICDACSGPSAASVSTTTESDIALHVAGRSLRNQARELRREHPIRSFLAFALRVHTDEKAWDKGAVGEEKVGKELENLGPEWRVLHSIPVTSDGADIDHLVIGPPGVFTINTKYHVGKKVVVYERALYVSGQKQAYLTKGAAEARFASRQLSAATGQPVLVRPLIVVLSSDLVVKQQPASVTVKSRRQVVKWLLSQPALPLVDVEMIFAAARQKSTWLGAD